MKVSIVSVLSLGILSLPFLVVGLEYNCTGQEMFPDFFASPFIFKSTSLATSMAYDYYALGLFGNCLLWGSLIVVIDYLISKILKKTNIKIFKVIYKFIIGFLLIFSLMSIYLQISVCSQSIIWKANLKEEAKIWGMKCNGELVIMK